MKKIFMVTLLLFALIVSCKTYGATRGVIVYYKYPKIVIATNSGYTYGKIYSSTFLSSRYEVVGELENYGLHDIYCLNTDTTFNMWIENFWSSRQRAQDWINEKY